MRRRIGTIVLGALLVAGLGAAPMQADGNQPPVAVDDPAVPGCLAHDWRGGAYAIAEDWNGRPHGLEPWFTWYGPCQPLANDIDPDGDPLALELVGQPDHGEAVWVGIDPPTLGYLPDPDWSTLPGNVDGGTWVSDAIHYRVSDGIAWSNPASFRVWIAPMNDAPMFTPGASLVEAEVNGAPVSVPWATAIDAGPDEPEQSVSSWSRPTTTTLLAPSPCALRSTPRAP